MSPSNQPPLMNSSDYEPPIWLRNGHLATIFPALFRKITLPEPYHRERMETEDGDFLDLDWLKGDREKLVIVSHGLEGNSERPYIRGMANAFWSFGFDVLAWNYRGCSEEMNRNLRMYHSGATDDLGRVVNHASASYEKIYLVGFSLGGNLTLKYLGEQAAQSKIRKAVVFSVPLDLSASSDHISLRQNRLYELRFLKSLRKKVLAKSLQFPSLDTSALDTIDTLRDFDDVYTSHIHGFDGAAEYYRRCSSMHFLDDIKTHTLVVNAVNDPFLPQECLETKLFRGASHAQLELPKLGGHCGFAAYDNPPLYWSEQRAVAYCLMDE